MWRYLAKSGKDYCEKIEATRERERVDHEKLQHHNEFQNFRIHFEHEASLWSAPDLSALLSAATWRSLAARRMALDGHGVEPPRTKAATGQTGLRSAPRSSPAP